MSTVACSRRSFSLTVSERFSNYASQSSADGKSIAYETKWNDVSEGIATLGRAFGLIVDEKMDSSVGYRIVVSGFDR